MAAFWDIVGKAANLFQLFGVDAITLITSPRMVDALLYSPAGCWIMQQGHLELGHLLTNALRDAQELVKSYNGSTVFARLRRGRSMATRLRDLRSSIDSYCGLIVSVKAFILIEEADHPPSLVIR